MGNFFSILAILFVVLLSFYFGLPMLHTIWQRRQFRQLGRKQGMVALTFDDGPGSRLTPRVLEILREFEAPATFFFLGRNLPGREPVLQEVADAGHQVGFHGYGHKNYLKTSPWSANLDFVWGRSEVKRVLGNNRKLYFRPPYGKLSGLNFLRIIREKTPIINWSLDSGDTWPEAKRDVNGSARGLARDGGGVILLHDFDREDEQGGDFVCAMLRRTLEYGRENGLRFVTIEEYLCCESRVTSRESEVVNR